MTKPQNNVAYTIKGHIKASGFKSTLRGCYFIDGEWYRPTIREESGESIHRNALPDDEIGWDYEILPDDFVIDSYDKEDKK